MKKNKVTVSLFVLVCVLSIIVGYSLIKHDSNKYNQLAVMIKQDDGSYIRSNMSAFGNEDYEFDHAVCNNGSTVTANASSGVNLKLLGIDKCTVYLKQTIIGKIKLSAKESTSSMYSAIEPSNEIKSVTDNKFSKGEKTYTVDTTHQNYYMTYASAYTFNTPTMTSSGTDYPTYTLTEPQVGKYSEIYSSLKDKYIVNYEGHNNSTAAKSDGVDRIYKVVSATADSITYKPSSYTMEFTNNGTTGVYTTKDDYGTSYYFRGNVTNNYVKFGKWTEEVYRGYNTNQSEYKDFFTSEECQADETYKNGCNKSPVAGKDMYWRIVRINGDGTLRLMYDGTEAHANGTKSLNKLAIQYQKFNNEENNNAYVGYMYGDTAGITYEEVHANINDSLIKIAIETWYEKNFVETEYANNIGDMSFCNDRSLHIGTGVGTITTYYNVRKRLVDNGSSNPILTCPQKNDIFTVSDITKGNGALTYPIGLLTADEVTFTGGKYTTNNRGYFINKGYQMRLGTASGKSNLTYVFIVTSYGSSDGNAVANLIGAAPVINLSAEAANQLKGSGTMEDPYHF